jgi:hypothetical protein
MLQRRGNSGFDQKVIACFVGSKVQLSLLFDILIQKQQYLKYFDDQRRSGTSHTFMGKSKFSYKTHFRFS